MLSKSGIQVHTIQGIQKVEGGRGICQTKCGCVTRGKKERSSSLSDTPICTPDQNDVTTNDYMV